MNTLHQSSYATSVQRTFFGITRHLLALLCLVLIAMAVAGCAKREKVIEVDAPGTSIDVERVTKPDGDVDLKIESTTP